MSGSEFHPLRPALDACMKYRKCQEYAQQYFLKSIIDILHVPAHLLGGKPSNECRAMILYKPNPAPGGLAR